MDLFDWAVAQDVIQPEAEDNSCPGALTDDAPMTLPSLPLDRPPPCSDSVDADTGDRRDSAADVARVSYSTFSAALAALESEQRIPAGKLYRWASDIACVAKQVGATPETLPMASEQLVPLLEAVKPTTMPGGKRLRDKRWSSMQSSLRAVAREVGLLAKKRNRHMPSALSMAWQPCLEALPKLPRSPLMSFIRWCDERRIGPTGVTESTLEDYGTWRAANTYTKRLPVVLRDVRMAWNGLQRRIPDWPGRWLASSAGKRRNARLQTEDLQPTCLADLEAYLAGLRATNPLEGRGKALAEPTIKLYRSTVLQAITIRASQLGGPEAIPDLACLVTPEAMRAILLHRYAVDGNVWRPTAVHLATVLVGVAKDHLGLCDTDLERLRALQRKVTATRPGRLPEKVRDRLAQFDDLKLRKDLFTLADTLCEEAERMRAERPFQAAAHHRRGLLLHILLMSALRRRNLITLNLQEDFMRDQNGRIHGLRVKRTKNGITIQADFTPKLIRLFERHMTAFRPRLPGAASPWLVPSPDGTTHASIGGQAAKLAVVVRHRLGADFNVHLTRHIVATILYEQEGDNSVLAQRTLGHTEVKGTRRMYGELGTAGAHHQWGGMIDRIVSQRVNHRRKGGKR